MKATCPTCQEPIEVGTLKELQAHLKKCGKTKKAKPIRRSLLPNATTLPTLPFTLKVARKWESQNHSHKQHWTTHSKSVAAWHAALEVPLAPLLGLDLDWSRWSFLRLIPKTRGRVYDYANLVGGGKAMVDTLVHYGIIHDDSPKHFLAEYNQVSQSDRQALEGIHTIITLLEVR